MCPAVGFGSAAVIVGQHSLHCTCLRCSDLHTRNFWMQPFPQESTQTAPGSSLDDCSVGGWELPAPESDYQLDGKYASRLIWLGASAWAETDGTVATHARLILVRVGGHAGLQRERSGTLVSDWGSDSCVLHGRVL
jgi:hypothetical protein